MIKNLIILSLLGMLSAVHAQYVDVPDYGLLRSLKEQYPSCFNESNQLDTTCAATASVEFIIIQNESALKNLYGLQFFKNTRNLDIRNSSLRNLRYLPAGLTTLTVSFSKLTKVDSLPNTLEFLTVSDNYISEIVSLPQSLKHLNVSNNKLSTLPTLPPTLKALYAWKNYFATAIPKPSPDILDGDWDFTNQKKYFPTTVHGYVMLPDTGLTRILKNQFPTCFNIQNQLDTNCADMLNVTRYTPAEAYEYELTDPLIPYIKVENLHGIHYLKSLESLSFGGNFIKEIPKLPVGLTYLDLGGNKLTYVPNLPNGIKELYLTRNNILNIERFPDEMLYANLHDNKLSSLPPLPDKVKFFAADRNCLKIIPERPATVQLGDWHVSEMYKIQNSLTPGYVAIKDEMFKRALQNSYSYIFNAQGQMDTTDLRMLNDSILTAINMGSDVEYKIESLDEIKYFKNLKLLLLKGNLINRLPQFPPLLRVLDLSSNKLTSIDGLPSGIKELDISDNKFVTIGKLPDSLNVLDVSYNKLSSLPVLPAKLLKINGSKNCFATEPLKPASFQGVWNFANQWVYKSHTLPAYISIEDTIMYYSMKGRYYQCFGKNRVFDKNCIYIQQDTIYGIMLPSAKSVHVFDHFSSLRNLTINLYNTDSTLILPDSTVINMSKDPLVLNAPQLRTLIISGSIAEIRQLPKSIKELSLYVNGGRISSLPDSLEKLNIGGITNFDLRLTPMLKEVSIAGRLNSFEPFFPDSLRRLNISSIIDLWKGVDQPLDLSRTQLSELHMIHMGLKHFPKINAGLKILNLGSNNIAEIPYEALHEGLERFSVSGSPLHCLPKLPNSLVSLDFSRDFVACVPNIGPHLEEMYYDTATQQMVSRRFVYPICDRSFNPSACYIYNSLSGQAYFDANHNDTLDLGERPVAGLKVTVNGRSAFSNSQGYYQISLDDTLGSYLITADSMPGFKVTTPTRLVQLTKSDTSIVHDFAVNPVADTVFALNTQLFPIHQFARPGFAYTYRMLLKNEGNITADARFLVLLDSNRFVLDSISVDSATVKKDSVSGKISSLEILQLKVVNLYGRIKPSAVLGDTLWTRCIFTDTSNRVIDIDTSFAVIRGSFDPNDKLATPVLTPPQVQKGEFVEYVINFQNMGTDTAFNIIVKDTLPQKLDLSSLEVVHASHLCKANLEGQVLTFDFRNILLPDNKVNEPASHGYVNFRIRPLKNVKENENIENKAYIYFDFNAPIITNTAYTFIGYPKNRVVGVDDNDIVVGQWLHPNPVVDVAYVFGEEGEMVSVYTLQGVEQLKTTVKEGKIDLKTLPNGLYYFKLGNRVGRFVKE